MLAGKRIHLDQQFAVGNTCRRGIGCKDGCDGSGIDGTAEIHGCACGAQLVINVEPTGLHQTRRKAAIFITRHNCTRGVGGSCRGGRVADIGQAGTVSEETVRENITGSKRAEHITLHNAVGNIAGIRSYCRGRHIK